MNRCAYKSKQPATPDWQCSYNAQANSPYCRDHAARVERAKLKSVRIQTPRDGAFLRPRSLSHT